MKFLDNKTIENNKEITELDKFVFDFIGILEKYTDYVIISGYVSILLGRSRSTEDVDIFIKELNFEMFSRFYEELRSSGFWCLNGDKPHTLYEYFEEGLALRFAYDQQAIPNIEVKIARKGLDKESFVDRITVKTKIRDLFISSLERQIAFKRFYLGSKKDQEDANHIEGVFREHINLNMVNYYKRLIDNEMADSRQEQSGRKG